MKITVRVTPDSAIHTLYCCALAFTPEWCEVEVDAATRRAFEAQQYLEVRELTPKQELNNQTDGTVSAGFAQGSALYSGARKKSAKPAKPLTINPEPA